MYSLTMRRVPRVAALIVFLSFYGLFFCKHQRAVAEIHHGRPAPQIDLNRSSFPPGFVFGAGTSAYQIEGAPKENCKGPSSWDVFTHQHPEMMTDRSNGDVAIDSYHRYKEDISLLKDAGMDAYRFSISWARILPNGSLSGGICVEGIQYYNNLINEIIHKGLQPFVTLLHMEYPQILITNYQGFISQRFIDDFRDFSDICFKEFGDRVKHWITINEPSMLVEFAYSQGIMPPLRCSSCIRHTCTGGDSCREPYIGGHNLLLAHALVVQLYREKYQESQKGQIGITVYSPWFKPYSKIKTDYEAASRALDFTLGWFLDPLTQGEYPFIMRALVGDRLPRINQKQSILIKGSFDFIGINYYSTGYVQSVSLLKPISCCSYESDSYTLQTGMHDGKSIVNMIGGSYPGGLEEVLLYIKEKYNNPIIYITENGLSEKTEEHTSVEEALQDDKRIEYHKDHLYFLQQAITKGANVKGYFEWSFLDSFELNLGYTKRFGIIYVDFEDDLKRHPKKSFYWFRAFLLQSRSKLTRILRAHLVTCF